MFNLNPETPLLSAEKKIKYLAQDDSRYFNFGAISDSGAKFKLESQNVRYEVTPFEIRG